jgi:hypothetical protein
MKKMAKFALTLGLLAVGTALAPAQEVEYHVQNVNVALTGFAQGGEGDTLTADKVRITTRDLIAATGAAENPRGAKLLVMTPTADPEASSSFVVRTGTGRNAVDTDVSGFFSGQTWLIVEKSTLSGSGERRGTQYSIDTFGFGGEGSPVSFNVQGFTTTSLANQNLTSNVNGTGNVNGADAVLRGTVKITGNKIEVVVPAP